MTKQVVIGLNPEADALRERIRELDLLIETAEGYAKDQDERIAQLSRMLDAALDDDWENPELVAYRTIRSGWHTEESEMP